jgi:hypothetical protein
MLLPMAHASPYSTQLQHCAPLRSPYTRATHTPALPCMHQTHYDYENPPPKVVQGYKVRHTL